MADYYDYKELREAAISGDEDALNGLGEWMEQYGSAYWNGEYYDISSEGEPSGSLRLFPVYAEVQDTLDGDYDTCDGQATAYLKGDDALVLCDGMCHVVLDGEDHLYATGEIVDKLARKVNEDFAHYRGWDAAHIAAEGMEAFGCLRCPFRATCDAMHEDVRVGWEIC